MGKQSPASKSSVKHQVMWNRLISIVEEQAQALIRTAFSTSVREAGDLSAGVYDIDGQMLAQAVTGTPGHVNSMAAAVGHFITDIGIENMYEGDVLITNDPWKGTGHLHDITIVTPAYYKAKLIGFLACTCHVVDIGGIGFTADANSVFEEGLYIPLMKLSDKGQINEAFLNIVRANVREPDQVVGDLFALMNCNEVGHKRLCEMMDEFKLSSIAALAEFILDNSRRATLEKINALPRGRAQAEMVIDGYNDPIKLQLALEIKPDEIICDFDGTDGIDRKGINVPLVYTQAYACYALKCAIAPEIPNNAASLAPFVITAPENSIVNALHPAPVALRHIIGHFIPDVVYNALDKVVPGLVPTEGAGALCNFHLSIRPTQDEDTLKNLDAADLKRAEILTFNSGGTGARPHLDGLNATAFPSGVMTMPVESTENAGPVVIWRKELAQDSGGDGEFRGGLGQHMEVSVLEGHEYDFSAMFDRVNHPARGRQGGAVGGSTLVELDDGTVLKGKGKHAVPAGRKVILEFPGGGGYGMTNKRALEKVRDDLAKGYISQKRAREVYGLSEAEISEVLAKVKKGEYEK